MYLLRGFLRPLWLSLRLCRVFVYADIKIAVKPAKGFLLGAAVLLLVKLYQIAVEIAARVKAFKVQPVAVWIYRQAVAGASSTIAA